MPMGTLFTPFSQKYLLRERYLRGNTNGPLRLVIDCDLHWHWGVREDNFFAEIVRDFEELIRKPFTLYASESECIVQDQPSWDMQISATNSRSNAIRGRKHSDSGAEDRTPCHNWRMEHLAYYCPAHTHQPAEYGIHLTKRGVAHVAHQVHQLCPDEPLSVVQLASVYMLFAHEMCHAWIEDINCLADFSDCATAPARERTYANIQRRYNGYIFMEEAICNTAAYGWLKDFLRASANAKPDMPAFTSNNVLNAFEQWMRRQPKGYRDFLPITDVPHQSSDFILNLCRLLTDVHEIADREVCEAVGVFFGGRVTPDCLHFSSRNANRWDKFWIGEPPLHVAL